MPTAHITHTTRLPRFLTAAAASAAALAASAPFANAADTTWDTSESVTNTRDITGYLIIENSGSGPIVEVTAPGKVTDTGIVYIGKTANNKGTLNITNGGKVASNSATGGIVVGEEGGSEGIVTVSGDNSTLDSAYRIYIGNGGIGKLDISAGGKVSVANSAYFGAGVSSKGEVTVRGAGSSFETPTIQIGSNGEAKLDILDGGTFTSTGMTYIARESGSEAKVTVSGDNSSFNALHLYVGAVGDGTLEIAAGGKVNVSGGTYVGIWGTVANGGILNLRTGGTLTTPLILGGSGTATLNFNGGTLRAANVQANFFQSIGTITLNGAGLAADAPALIFNTNGYDITSSTGGTAIFTGSGGLTKIGTGTLTLTGTHTYTGTTTVSAGALAVVGTLGTLDDKGHQTHVGNIVLNGGSMSFANPGVPLKFTGILSGAGTITFASSQSVIVAGAISPGVGSAPGRLEFTETGGVVLAEGARFIVDLNAFGLSNENDLLIIEGGNLVLDGAQLVLRRGAKFPLWGAKGGSEVVIAKVVENGAEITGMFANVDEKKFVTDATGRRALVSVRANIEGGQDLILTMFPEPSTYALLGGTGVLLLALFRKRRQQRMGRRL